MDEEPLDLRQVARLVLDSPGAKRRTAVGRVVAFTGFGGRRADEAVLVSADGTHRGTLLGGVADEAVEATTAPVELVEVAVGDADAVSAGLACGGVATVLVTSTDAVPARAWEALAAGSPVVLATLAHRTGVAGSVLALVGEKSSGRLERVGSLADPGEDERAEEKARQAIRLGHDSSELHEQAESTLVVEVHLPTTTLVVCGQGDLSDALERQAGLLGWSVVVEPVSGSPTKGLIASLGPSDALVVLEHDHDVATPLLAAALATGCYVGALGSRHTQAERRARLLDAKVSAGDVERVHGPAGLDLGSRSPAETAVAIAAEILAHRSGRDGSSLSRGEGPING